MTPMQELITLWEKQRDEAPIHFKYKGVYDLFIKDAKEYLEKEKQMVIDAYDTNISESLKSNKVTIISGEQYYQDNFKQ